MNQSQGGFSVNGAKCPSCNGSLDLSGGFDVVVCPFCGTSVHVSYSHANQNSGIEPDGTIRDRGTGYGLFRVTSAAGWQVTGTALRQTGCTSRPYVPEAELRDHAGGMINARMGDGGTRNSAGMNSLMSMYGGHLAGIDTANYAEMPNPLTLAEVTASDLASSMGASSLRFIGQFEHPNLEGERQRGYARFQQFARAQGAMISDPFAAVVLRTYELSCNGQPWNMAVYLVITAVKDASGVGEGIGGLGAGMLGGIGDLMGSLGNLFGGLGQPQQTGQWGTQVPMQQAPMQQVPSPNAPWCVPDYAHYVHSGTIYWSVSPIVTFVAPPEDFNAQFKSMFIPFASTLDIHPDIESLAISAAKQEAAQVQSATQSQLARNQAAFQAQQAAHRQMQAAFDSYNQSITAASDAHHQQFMASSREQFDHRAPDYSEAIRGVNTYTTSDGREVQLSVQADRAYENQAGDVIGTSGSFTPGADWTEIPRT